MFTYGYLREAVIAHCDLEEDELQAMNALKRLHIFANEAMHAICACKPNYKYFKIKAVERYKPVIKILANNQIIYREATDNELDKLDKLNVADDIATREYYSNNNVYEINKPIKLPEDFIAFTNKQSFKRIVNEFNPEDFIYNDWGTNEAERLEPVVYDKDISFTNTNIICLKPGEYLVPYKCVWYIFTSALPDTAELDIPIDILNCLPLYIASVILQMDYAQKAQIKRSEFELALSRVTATNNMPVNRIMPSF